MIYLKPRGGLCNRMRTLDSVVTLCKKYQIDLTVLWVNDPALNCPFSEIFELPAIKGFRLTIIDCPIRFPEDYPKVLKGNEGHPTLSSALIRNLKNIIKGRHLSKELKKIRDTIASLDPASCLKHEELSKIYNSNPSIQIKSGREMDEIFIDKVIPRIDRLLSRSNGSIYITSCYRLYPRENNYSLFIPERTLRNNIKTATSNFSNIRGLHIRRTDHTISKNYSTTQKFVDLVNSILDKDPDATFFLSTDDSLTKKELISKYGSKIVSNNISSYDRNSPEAVKDAVVDLYCLAATEKVYGSHQSSFSQTAADLGHIEEITVK